MEKKKKAKPMTAREKKERAEIRKDLRERGILPPKKKPLNRKVFAERAKEALKKQAGYTLNLYLHWALLEMLEKQDYSRPGAIVYSQEAVGAAKVVLLAVRRMEFEEEKAGQRFTNGELYEAIKDKYEPQTVLRSLLRAVRGFVCNELSEKNKTILILIRS